MVDAAKLRALLDRLRHIEAELRRLRDAGPETVRDDVDRLNSVKYLFVLAAEVAIDVGQHVIASEGLEVPETFAGVFEELAKGGWVPEELATSLAAMARFRNLLVHGEHPHEVVVDGLHVGVHQVGDPALDSGVEHRHRLRKVEQGMGPWLLARARGPEKFREPGAKTAGGLQPPIQVLEVPAHRRGQVPGLVVQRPGDLAQRQPQPAQQ